MHEPPLAGVIRGAALDKKAEEVATIDLTGRTTIADAFILATGRSKIQTRAIAEAIVEAAESEGAMVYRVEGYHDGGWILVDLGDVVAHVFTPELRTFYNLERLWGAATAVGDRSEAAR
ncbi:MAG: ribosome silencing factor [bacterium]|nr:ribosome silencing factor [bacterium]